MLLLETTAAPVARVVIVAGKGETWKFAVLLTVLLCEGGKEGGKAEDRWAGQCSLI